MSHRPTEIFLLVRKFKGLAKQLNSVFYTDPALGHTFELVDLTKIVQKTLLSTSMQLFMRAQLPRMW